MAGVNRLGGAWITSGELAGVGQACCKGNKELQGCTRAAAAAAVAWGQDPAPIPPHLPSRQSLLLARVLRRPCRLGLDRLQLVSPCWPPSATARLPHFPPSSTTSTMSSQVETVDAQLLQVCWPRPQEQTRGAGTAPGLEPTSEGCDQARGRRRSRLLGCRRAAAAAAAALPPAHQHPAPTPLHADRPPDAERLDSDAAAPLPGRAWPPDRAAQCHRRGLQVCGQRRAPRELTRPAGRSCRLLLPRRLAALWQLYPASR